MVRYVAARVAQWERPPRRLRALWSQVSDLFASFELGFHLLLYSPEEDVACLLKRDEDAAIVHCWSMPWAEFHHRCAAPPQLATDVPPLRLRHGHAAAGSPVPALRPALPEGAPRIPKAQLLEMARQREATKASAHLVTPVVSHPRDLSPPRMRAATEEAVRKLRAVCAHLATVLDSGARLGPPLHSSPEARKPDTESAEQIMRRSKAEAKKRLAGGTSPVGRRSRFFYAMEPEHAASAPALPSLKPVPHQTALGMRTR